MDLYKAQIWLGSQAFKRKLIRKQTVQLQRLPRKHLNSSTYDLWIMVLSIVHEMAWLTSTFQIMNSCVVKEWTNFTQLFAWKFNDKVYAPNVMLFLSLAVILNWRPVKVKFNHKLRTFNNGIVKYTNPTKRYRSSNNKKSVLQNHTTNIWSRQFHNDKYSRLVLSLLSQMRYYETYIQWPYHVSMYHRILRDFANM